MGEERDFDIDITFIKKHRNIIFLFIILVLGFYLRLYHVDYPVVGYHNWKEVHYLTEARNFARDGFFKYGFFVPYHSISGLNDDISGVHPDTFPMISVIVGFFFMIFGPSLTVARLVGIFFSVGTVALMYFFAQKLFNREDIALSVALIAAINPLLVFFSHNTQLVNPGIFFMVLSGYFFLCFMDKYSMKYIILTSISATLAALAKYPFLLIGIPMFFIFSTRLFQDYQKSKKKTIKQVKQLIPALVVSGLILSSVFVWIAYSNSIREKYIGKGSESAGGLVDMVNLKTVFEPDFWPIFKSFLSDNFTLMGVGFAIIGLIFVILFLRKGEGFWFVFWYFIGAIPWFFIMSEKLMGHNYHQFPIAPLFFLLVGIMYVIMGANIQKLAFSAVKNTTAIAVFIAISLFVSLGFYIPGIKILLSPIRAMFGPVAEFLHFPFFLFMILIFSIFFGLAYIEFRTKKEGMVKWFFIMLMVFVLYFPSQSAWNRMFDTQFPGLDVAGEYINANSGPDDLVIHSSHQSYGVLWHADRVGFKPPSDVEGLMQAEQKGARWYFIYAWQFPRYLEAPNGNLADNLELWDYLQQNYHLVQIGVIQYDKPNLQYVLLEKGGSFNASNLFTAANIFIQGKQPAVTEYEFSMGKIPLYYFQ